MRIELTLAEILKALPDGELEGKSSQISISGIAALDKAGHGDLSFLGNSKYRSQVSDCRASLVLLPKDFVGEPKKDQAYLRLDDPSHALAILCGIIEHCLFPRPPPGVDESAQVENGAQVADTAFVGPYSYVGERAILGSNVWVDSHVHVGSHVRIGADSRLFAGVKVLGHCEMGKRVTLNAGVVIGSEGFGFDQVSGRHEKIPHLGKVVIEDDVEIGANSCIDRSRFSETRIGAGTKIDNLVQIGHNVVIGKRCLVVAQAGISGSVTFEDDVVVGGQAGFAGHITIGHGAKIAGQAGITKDVEAGAFLKGNPALPVPLAHRIAVLQRKLPELFKRFADFDSNS